MTEGYRNILDDSRKCLHSMCDINIKISQALKKEDYELLLKVLDDREATLERLKILKGEIDRMKEGRGANSSAKLEGDAIIREICQLISSLSSEGDRYVETIRRNMACIESKLQEILKGKRVLNGYRGKRKEDRGAIFIG